MFSGRPSVRPSVRTSVRTYVPPRALGQPLRGLGQPLRGLRGGGTDGRMDGRTDVQIPPILQDFVSSGSLRSRCPKSESKGIDWGKEKETK